MSRAEHAIGSFSRMPRHASGDRRLKARHWRVLCAICGAVDGKTATARISQRRISETAALSRKHVGKAIEDLVAWEYLAPLPRRRTPLGRWATTRYRLVYAPVPTRAHKAANDNRAPYKALPDRDAPRGGTGRDVAQGGGRDHDPGQRGGTVRDAPRGGRFPESSLSDSLSIPEPGHADRYWADLAMRLAQQGRYVEEWGYGAESLARDDVDQLRQRFGDRRAAKRLKGLLSSMHGKLLRDTIAKIKKDGSA